MSFVAEMLPKNSISRFRASEFNALGIRTIRYVRNSWYYSRPRYGERASARKALKIKPSAVASESEKKHEFFILK